MFHMAKSTKPVLGTTGKVDALEEGLINPKTPVEM